MALSGDFDELPTSVAPPPPPAYCCAVCAVVVSDVMVLGGHRVLMVAVGAPLFWVGKPVCQPLYFRSPG